MRLSKERPATLRHLNAHLKVGRQTENGLQRSPTHQLSRAASDLSGAVTTEEAIQGSSNSVEAPATLATSKGVPLLSSSL